MAVRSGKGATKKRLLWVDAAKGIGILLVIAGHVWWRPGPVHRVIYAFHMPLFFILSGYTATPQAMLPLIGRLMRTLLVPFIAFSLILIGLDLAVEGARGARPIFPDIATGLKAIVLDTQTLRGPFTILWFIPCLLLARIGWNAMARLRPDPFDRMWLVAIPIIMAAGHWMASRGMVLPLGLIAVPAALTCLWIGQMWKMRSPGPALALFLLMPLAAMTFLHLPPVNLKPGDFGLPVLSLAGAAAVTILIGLVLSRLRDGLLAPLAWLGRASLVIMYVHVAFIHYLMPSFGRGALFVIALAGSVAVHLAASATRPGRLVLLGER